MKPFDLLLELAREKHLGMDEYWLAVALAQVEQVGVLPHTVKPVTPDELKAFFVGQANELMDRAGAPRSRKCRPESSVSS